MTLPASEGLRDEAGTTLTVISTRIPSNASPGLFNRWNRDPQSDLGARIVEITTRVVPGDDRP